MKVGDGRGLTEINSHQQWFLWASYFCYEIKSKREGQCAKVENRALDSDYF